MQKEDAYVLVNTSLGNYKGQQVEVAHEEPCSVEGHALEVMLNYGNVTGFLWCPYCAGVADDPDVECTSCPDCGSRRLQMLTTQEPFRFRCRPCGHVFVLKEEE